MAHPPRAELEKLLVSLLGEADVRRIIRVLPGGEGMHAELPGAGVSLTALVHQAVNVLERHGRLDGAFFEVLVAERPARRDEIQALATRMRDPAVAAPPMSEITPPNRAKTQEHTPNAPGTILAGHYELLELLGEGGLSTVYHARDLASQRDVVVKWVRTHSRNERDRLMRESRLLATFAARIPGVVQYLDFVQNQDELYLITEYVRGGTLRDWQSRAGWTRNEILAVYQRIAEVLHEVHQAGVVHRDLKPSNVMLEEGEPPGRVVLIDFGFAIMTSEDDVLTGAGTLIGTPTYISPEILKGQTATPASDVFALGVMLCEALVGHLPWPRSNVAEVIFAVLTAPPELGALTGTPLGTLIKAMLATEPTARPNALEVMHALVAVQQAPQQAPPILALDTSHRDAAAPSLERAPAEMQAAAPRPWLLPGLAGAAAVVALLLGLYHDRLSGFGIGPAALLWLAIPAAAMLVGLGRRQRRSEQQAVAAPTLSPAMEARLHAIERRLEHMNQVSSSIVVELGELRPHLDPGKLERMLRESILIAVSELKVGADAGDVGKAIKALADVAQRGDGSPPWHKRVSTWLTLGGLVVGVAGGSLGLMSSAGIWKPNAPPTIRAITVDRERATRTAPIELRVDAMDPEGRPLSYEYAATAGHLASDGPLALWQPDPAAGAGLVRIDVTVSDGASHASQSRTLRINRRPALALTAPASAARGASIQVTADGPPDPDGDPLTYRWSMSAGQLHQETSRQATLTAPAEPGVIEVRCTVSDGWEMWDLDGKAIAIQ